MIQREDCYLLGIITKVHGIAGELVLKLNNILTEELHEMESVFIEIDGLLVPFFIEYIKEISDNTVYIKIEDINIDRANFIIQNKVFILKSILSNKRLNQDYSFLSGFKVSDKVLGEIGIIRDYIDYEKNPLLRVRNSTKDFLIPFTKPFIVKIDIKQKVVIVLIAKELIEL